MGVIIVLTLALKEIEARRALGFDSAYLSISRYGNSRKAISELRDQLHQQGYKTRIEKGSGSIVVEWGLEQ